MSGHHIDLGVVRFNPEISARISATTDEIMTGVAQDRCRCTPQGAGATSDRYLASPGPASDAWAGRATPLPTTPTKAVSIVKVSNLLRSIDVSLFWCRWMLGNGQSPGGRPIYAPDERAKQIYSHSSTSRTYQHLRPPLPAVGCCIFCPLSAAEMPYPSTSRLPG